MGKLEKKEKLLWHVRDSWGKIFPSIRVTTGKKCGCGIAASPSFFLPPRHRCRSCRMHPINNQRLDRAGFRQQQLAGLPTLHVVSFLAARPMLAAKAILQKRKPFLNTLISTKEIIALAFNLERGLYTMWDKWETFVYDELNVDWGGWIFYRHVGQPLQGAICPRSIKLIWPLIYYQPY